MQITYFDMVNGARWLATIKETTDLGGEVAHVLTKPRIMLLQQQQTGGMVMALQTVSAPFFEVPEVTIRASAILYMVELSNTVPDQKRILNAYLEQTSGIKLSATGAPNLGDFPMKAQ